MHDRALQALEVFHVTTDCCTVHLALFGVYGQSDSCVMPEAGQNIPNNLLVMLLQPWQTSFTLSEKCFACDQDDLVTVLSTCICSYCSD